MLDNIKINHEEDLIKTTVTGILDLAVSKQALFGIATEVEQSGEYRILIDLRQVETMPSVGDFFELGISLASYPALRRSKIVLLTSISEAENARFFENVAVNRGVRLKAFTNIEEAIAWLVKGK
ncbi:MAG TPA: STAS/SEC14 domain-containing protein [Anaerolineales bacterium]|nr:STAS/SEC14 domain-containing protein [Anaerolineales bacterium]